MITFTLNCCRSLVMSPTRLQKPHIWLLVGSFELVEWELEEKQNKF